MPLIVTDRLCKIYNEGSESEMRALDSVNLTVERGQFIVIEGPSGSGKTTLLNLIGCLDEPSSGTIVMNGRELTGLKERQKADIRKGEIGFVFQAYNLIPVLTARENIEYVLVLAKVPAGKRKELVETTARRLGIHELLDKRMAQMSGGQQQRVAVARAIVGHPAIVLADEPTANLDSATGQNLMELMLQLNEEDGVTFIISSHDPMVIGLAKRRLHLKDGRIETDTIIRP